MNQKTANKYVGLVDYKELESNILSSIVLSKAKEKFTAEEQVIPQDNTDLMQRNNSDENIENKPENQAAQKLSDQLECAGAPNTNMSEISMVNKFINRLRTLVNIPG